VLIYDRSERLTSVELDILQKSAKMKEITPTSVAGRGGNAAPKFGIHVYVKTRVISDSVTAMMAQHSTAELLHFCGGWRMRAQYYYIMNNASNL
jgi:hypothetical protein